MDKPVVSAAQFKVASAKVQEALEQAGVPRGSVVVNWKVAEGSDAASFSVPAPDSSGDTKKPQWRCEWVPPLGIRCEF